MSRRDVFICHASEDKETLVKPLVELLRKNEISPWIDEDELEVGDFLNDSIHKALSSAKFGLVVFSSAFLEKSWANKELELIRQRERQEKEVILLPVIDDISEGVVLSHYPFLRDRRFLKLSESNVLIKQLKSKLVGRDSLAFGLRHDDFLYQLRDFNNVLYWTARPVPIKETKAFFGALQRFFNGYNIFADSVSDLLTDSIDNICRVLWTCPDMGDGYGEGKLAASLKYCSLFLNKDRDYEMDIKEAEHLCEDALRLRNDINNADRAALTIYLLLLTYLDAYSSKKGYHQLHHEVGNQLYELFSESVPVVMASELPAKYDQDGWERIYSQVETELEER
ncbi:toll/interleukin-1 receptor domain-containing protein [Neptuniibacter sp. QD34_54]|uniref:toll/interleukin-1 receptor domain-containing protein n=1 Tax=Neptuniibacter sp. QD34_54 TaxID=3398208 RepID=UPI0039F48B51